MPLSPSTTRLKVLAVTAGLALLGSLGLANPAQAAPSDRSAVLSNFTQTSASSYNTWNAARQNQSAWVAYGFDWSTDYCSSSPDNPLGFDFRLSCHRHDFGYRNYKSIGTFPANKSRLDSAFYSDLKRKCATYSSWVRPACDSLAWVYYQAVSIFGSVSAVKQSDLDAAAKLKAAGLKAQANAA